MKHKSLVNKRFGRLVIKKEIDKYKSETVYLSTCDCGNSLFIRSGSLTKQTRPTRSCGCLRIDLLKKRKQLEHGQAHLNRLFRQYENNAKKRKLKFQLTKKEFELLITSNCIICNIEPKQVEYKKSYKPNGFISHNGIDRIDNNIGYINSNVRTMCSNCNRAKSNLTEQEFNEWLNRIVIQRHIKKGVAV